MTDWRVGMHNGCAQQVYFWPMVVKFGPRESQVMKKIKMLSDFWMFQNFKLKLLEKPHVKYFNFCIFDHGLR